MTKATGMELPEVWDAITKAGATIYEWCEQGVATGVQVVLIGDRHCITVTDSEGYKLEEITDYEESWELVASDEYNEETATRAASELDGYFGIIGVPGSQYHDFEWFPNEPEARDWANRRHDETIEANPVVGTLEYAVVPASEVFDVTYRDGNRVYFQPKEPCQRGFTPRWSEAHEEA